MKVEFYIVFEVGKVVDFKISDGEIVKVILDKVFEVNKEIEVKFIYKDKEFIEKVIYVVIVVIKIEGVIVSNYKELVVKFDGEVDVIIVENIVNYIVSGCIFEFVMLFVDKKLVIFFVEEILIELL